MSKRKHANVETTLMCAVKFWRIGADTPTLMAGVRHVVRKQGFAPTQINRAVRELSRRGDIRLGGKRTGKTVQLMRDVNCSTVKLAPWTDDGNPGAQLSGARRKRRR